MAQCLDGKTIPHFIGGPDRAVAEEVADLTKSAEEPEAFQDSVSMFLENDKAMYEKLLSEIPIKTRPGFWEAVDWLREADIGMAFGSSTPPEYAKILLKRSEILEEFSREDVILGKKVKDGKAIPDVWLECAKRLGVGADELLVFEDSPNGILGAVQVGASCVGMPVYNLPGVIMPLLNAGACRVFMDWREMNIIELLAHLNEERAKR